MIVERTTTRQTSPGGEQPGVRFADEWPPGGDEPPSLWLKTRATLQATIGEYPMAALGVAVFAGIALGWWIKRR